MSRGNVSNELLTLPSSDWPLVNPAQGLNEESAISDHCGRSSPRSKHVQLAVSMPRGSILNTCRATASHSECVCESEAEQERYGHSFEIAGSWRGSKWLFQIAHFNLIG